MNKRMLNLFFYSCVEFVSSSSYWMFIDLFSLIGGCLIRVLVNVCNLNSLSIIIYNV